MIQDRLSRGYAPSLRFVSTYPPTKCGLATFTHALSNAVAASRPEPRSIDVIRIVGANDNSAFRPSEVVTHLDPASSMSVRSAARRLDEADVAIIQHEFGIFGPDDGLAVLDLLERVRVPTIVTLHTVPASPSARQRDIVEGIVEMANSVVVMSEVARAALIDGYRAEPTKVSVIPHGAHRYKSAPSVAPGRPTILTWGLIGPGKGIEWGVKALPMLRELDPRPLYRVIGATHPNVLRAEGERYREGLVDLARRLGVQDMLEIRDGYLAAEILERFVGSADIVLLPYDSREQATSGVLIDAVAAGKPVVSTCFPHAAELLSSGAGVAVPNQDPEAIADALRRMLTDPLVYDRACRVARGIGASLAWPTVAGQYQHLAAALTRWESPEVA